MEKTVWTVHYGIDLLSKFVFTHILALIRKVDKSLMQGLG